MEFYGKHNISPIKQDISDFQKHMKRREQLYRMLGIPVIAFDSKDVLEVGPGSGYNTLCFFEWGSHVDLVEPNPKGREEIIKLFGSKNIDENRWNLSPSMIEEYESERKFDIIIAEGFLQSVPNSREIILKLSSLLKKGGAVVITSIDEISVFFDFYLRRILGLYLLNIKKVDDFEEKIVLLSKAFGRHFQNLKYASRPVDDWVQDNLLNTAAYSEFLSFDQSLEYFGNDFELLNSSPNMVLNQNWYKNTDVDFKKIAKKQFGEKRHLLMMTGLANTKSTAEINNELLLKCREVKHFLRDSGEIIDKTNLKKIKSMLEDIMYISEKIDNRIEKAIGKAISLLSIDNLTESQIADSEELWGAFGVYMYVSFVRKFTS